MKAEELRIGNLLHTFENKLTSVTDIVIGMDLETVCKPIELTKEWLIRFGFYADTVTYKLIFNSFRFVLFQINASNNYNDNINEFTVDIHEHKQCIRLCNIKYVHQLQNLFFALTNEELNLKI